MRHAGFRNDPNCAPTVNSANRGMNEIGYSGCPAERVDDLGCLIFHEHLDMRISQQSQEESCDNRFCEIRNFGRLRWMDNESIQKRLDHLNLKQRDIAVLLDLSPDKVSKVFTGTRQWKGNELTRILAWLDEIEANGDYVERPDIPPDEISREYLAVDVLPSYAGMGGGGSGEGEVQTGLVPRRFIEDELRASVSDLLLIETRGDSMEPDFMHGDQILIDKRDCNPVQPGSFALWDGDGYVIKLIERVPHKKGYYRIFSANSRFSSYEVSAEDIEIMGRPVWFARRL